MRLLFMIVLGLIAFAITLLLAYGFFRTWKTGRSMNSMTFAASALPERLPEGLYAGSVPELGEVSWKGKIFHADGTGINLFEKDGVRMEQYAFTFFEAASLGDSQKRIIRIDYSQASNPLWLRFIVDEIVSTGTDQFLGAVYITVIPGLPFRMGYFRLERQHPQ